MCRFAGGHAEGRHERFFQGLALISHHWGVRSSWKWSRVYMCMYVIHGWSGRSGHHVWTALGDLTVGVCLPPPRLQEVGQMQSGGPSTLLSHCA